MEKYRQHESRGTDFSQEDADCENEGRPRPPSLQQTLFVQPMDLLRK